MRSAVSKTELRCLPGMRAPIFHQAAGCGALGALLRNLPGADFRPTGPRRRSRRIPGSLMKLADLRKLSIKQKPGSILRWPVVWSALLQSTASRRCPGCAALPNSIWRATLPRHASFRFEPAGEPDRKHPAPIRSLTRDEVARLLGPLRPPPPQSTKTSNHRHGPRGFSSILERGQSRGLYRVACRRSHFSSSAHRIRPLS